MTNEDLELLDEPRKTKPIVHAKYFWRRRWWVLAPLFLFGVSSYVVAEFWPVLYRSEALILVEGQKVPEQYVTPNVVTTLQTRLDSMTQRILSRTRLQRLVEDFGLYPKERARVTMDEVIEMMRKNITVEVVQSQGRNGDVTGFRLAYAAGEPKTAQRVTNEITSLFIEESLRSRTQQSLSTTAFLENQLEQARKDLEEQEARLRQYKSQFIGELPEQQQANLQILSSLEAQLYAVSTASARADQQRVYLESLKSQYPQADESGKTQTTEDEPVAKRTPDRIAAENALSELRRQYIDAKGRYTEKYPVLATLKQQIADWERRIAQLDKDEAASASNTKPRVTVSTAPSTARSALAEINSRLKAIAIEIADYQKDEQNLRERIKDIQSHLNLTPVREQQLADVNRTYENSKANYQSLLQKKMQSELASNLEKRQQGEQFRILDPASLPHKAAGRLPIIVMGWGLGLALGVGLLAVRSLLDQTVRDKDDLVAQTDLPILIRLPVITTIREQRRREWRRFGEALTVALLVVAALAGAVRTYLIA